MYRVTTLVCYLVDFVLVVALSAWKGGNLAELAEQLDTMVEHPNQSQPNHITNQSCHPVSSVLIFSFGGVARGEKK